MRCPRSGDERGFSLLELLVAMAIMAISLGMIYRVTGGNVRNVVDIEQYQNASLFGESLMASLDGVPPAGLRETGLSGNFQWSLASSPYQQGASTTGPLLHKVEVVVVWDEQGRRREFSLVSLRPERDTTRLRAAQ